MSDNPLNNEKKTMTLYCFINRRESLHSRTETNIEGTIESENGQWKLKLVLKFNVNHDIYSLKLSFYKLLIIDGKKLTVQKTKKPYSNQLCII